MSDQRSLFRRIIRSRVTRFFALVLALGVITGTILAACSTTTTERLNLPLIETIVKTQNSCQPHNM